jgi:hypothetical protein
MSVGITGERQSVLLLEAIRKELIKFNSIDFSTGQVVFQNNSITFPVDVKTGDWVIVTSDGLPTGIILETWLYNGTTWNNLAEAYKNLSQPVVVDSYADLPVLPLDNMFYWVSNSQGVRWLPGNLGGTYYPKGLYYFNSVNWEYIETPYQATQLEVNTGTDTDKFVTPATLKGNLNLATFTIDLIDELDVVFYAPYDLRINTVTNIVNNPTVTIEVNGSPYTLTNLITQGSEIKVIVDVNGVVNLNVEYE